jgi:undecaprenyl-diphosphatase
MGTYFDRFFDENSLVRAVHTAVKGRARYKVNGLYRSQALKKYLESKLSQQEGIAQVRANHVTGNVLVISHPDFSPNAIALLLQDIVLAYRKQTRTHLSLAPAEAKNLSIDSTQLIVASVAVGTFGVGTALLHRYGLDEAILLAIQKLHSPLLDRIMLGITSLGESGVLLSICLGLGMGALYYNRRREATTLGVVSVGAIGLNYWLKILFGRARPELWSWIVDANHHSFPSGHAMMSMAIYGFIGYMLAKQFPQWRRRIVVSTAVLIVAIGFSRLYLGVHWPTDVLAGYAVGLAWLIACILYLELWQNYPKLKPQPNLA